MAMPFNFYIFSLVGNTHSGASVGRQVEILIHDNAQEWTHARLSVDPLTGSLQLCPAWVPIPPRSQLACTGCAVRGEREVSFVCPSSSMAIVSPCMKREPQEETLKFEPSICSSFSLATKFHTFDETEGMPVGLRAAETWSPQPGTAHRVVVSPYHYSLVLTGINLH